MTSAETYLSREAAMEAIAASLVRVRVVMVTGVALGVLACGQAAAPAVTAAIRVDTLADGMIRVDNRPEAGWTADEAWRLEEDLRLGTVNEEGPKADGRPGQ